MADLAVSLLSADFSCLEKQLQELKEADVKWLHIDVMDGNLYLASHWISDCQNTKKGIFRCI